MKTSQMAFLLATAALYPTELWPQMVESRLPEQRLFTAADARMRRPLRLPDEARRLLLGDTFIKNTLESEGLPLSVLPDAWVAVSEAHLGAPNERDLVIMGLGPLRGANVTGFWVLRPTSKGYVVVLSTHGLALEILSKMSNGLRDIEVSSATAVDLQVSWYRFRAGTYVKAADQRSPIQR